MNKEDKIFYLSTLIIFIVVTIVVFITLFTFRDDYTTVLEGYCEHHGGTWNFYECFNPSMYPCEKMGNYCDYPDGTYESEDEISWRFNSTI